MGEFAVRKESVSLKDEMGIWASTFLASVIVNGADTLRIIVRENDGGGSHENEEKKVIARGVVKLRSDASLRMMDRTYRVDRNKVYLGQKLYLQVNDTDADISEGQDEVTVQLAGPLQTVSVTLMETYPHSGLFRGSIRPVLPAEKIQKAKEKKVQETIVIKEDADTLNTKSTLGDDDGLEDDDDLAVEATKEDTLEVDLGDALKLTYTDTTPLSSWGLDEEGVRVKLPLDGSEASEAQELTVEGAIHMGGDAMMVAFTKRFEDDQVAVKTRFLMAEALFEIAKEQRKIGRKEAATESIARGKRVLTEALRDYPDTAQAVQGQYLLANLSQELGQYIEAIGMYKGVIIHWPKASYASKSQLKLAICYEKMKNYDQASEEYVRLIYRYPKSPLVADATVRMAQQYYVRKEYQVAGDIFVRFQANFPEHKLAAKALFLAAQCQMKNTDFAMAATIFTQLTTDYTEDKQLRAKSMYWAGDCYYQAGDFLQAYRRWTQLTWDYPESNWAKVARGKLTDEVMSGMKMAD
jgi:TolA-binding protein